MMMIFIQSNVNAHTAVVNPRKKAQAEWLEGDDISEKGNPKNTSLEAVLTATTEKDTGDTLTFSGKPKTDDDDIEETLSPKERKQALVKMEHQQRMQEGLDNEEIHKAKVSASWWASVPMLIGPIIGLVSNVFTSPEAEARKRSDVRYQDRDMDEAVEQERKIKGSKLKAALVTSVPQIVGAALYGGASLLLEKSNVKRVSTLAWSAVAIGTACILAPLGYQFGEKPEDPKFNQKL